MYDLQEYANINWHIYEEIPREGEFPRELKYSHDTYLSGSKKLIIIDLDNNKVIKHNVDHREVNFSIDLLDNLENDRTDTRQAEIERLYKNIFRLEDNLRGLGVDV